MKATKILIVAILVLATLTTFAQTEKGLFAMVKYSQEMNRFETWVTESHESINNANFHRSDLPVISATYYVDYTDISFKNEYSIEPWMTAPFKDLIYEENLNLESWMSKPFETEKSEGELKLEDWMSNPF